MTIGELIEKLMEYDLEQEIETFTQEYAGEIYDIYGSPVLTQVGETIYITNRIDESILLHPSSHYNPQKFVD